MPKTLRRSLPRGGLALILTVALLILLLPSGAIPAAAGADHKPKAARSWAAREIRDTNVPKRDRKLAQKLPGATKLGYHPETGRVRFLSGTPAKPLTAGVVAVAAGKRSLSGADARAKSRAFIDRYGPLFGLEAPGRELRVRAVKRRSQLPAGTAGPASTGRVGATVRFEQVRDGAAVLGGEIVVQLSQDGEVLSAAGEVLPSASKTKTKARVSAGRARTTARIWLARLAGRPASAVTTRSEGLGLYDPRLMDDPDPGTSRVRLVWRIDAHVPADGVVRAHHRLVLIDALNGDVVTTIGRVRTAEGPNRRICDNRNVRGRGWRCDSGVTRSEGQTPVGVSDVDKLYTLMGATYDFFADRFGRDGIDGQGSRMKATVRYCPADRCPWGNAEWKWAKQQAVFGRGWSRADDVVGHEFTHGVLDAEAPLFYHYQSGAINESYADVFGELIDLAYPGGKDTDFTKWKIGEDTPIGIFRDMRDPTRHGHPDRVRSPKWYSGSGDDGGVHRNSGVGNKAAVLVAAGGTFGGYSIKGIGRERMARVWYQALTTRLTPAANYVDLADALISACTDLAGSHSITFAHCAAVQDATRATQMNLTPKARAPRTAPLCRGGTTPAYVLNDDLEHPGARAWESATRVGGKKGWFWPQNPNDKPAWDGTWASSGRFNFYAPNRAYRSDAMMRMTTPVVLPAKAYLHFGHGYSFDRDAKRRYDGGIVEIRVDGGPWRSVRKLFTHGGYNGTIARGGGNPLAGRSAFTGSSHGWASARIDLSAYAGSRLKVRFRMGSDRSIGERGWYIDDVRIYTCTSDRDRPTGALTIDDDAATTADRRVTLGLSWDDATTWVTKVRLSGVSTLDGSGRLKKSITMAVRDTIAWDLADQTLGGSGRPGLRRVYAQVRDAAGNWSAVFSDKIEWLSP